MFCVSERSKEQQSNKTKHTQALSNLANRGRINVPDNVNYKEEAKFANSETSARSLARSRALVRSNANV